MANRIRTGLHGLSSAHIVADAGALAGTITGDYRYANATATAVMLDLGAGKGEIVTVGSHSWVKPPAGQADAAKPWVPVSSGSSNAFVRSVTPVLTVARAAGSLPALADVVATASTVTDKGTTSVAGAPAHEYALDVVPSKAPASDLTDLLTQLGDQTIPITLDLDQRGRPVHIVLTVAFGGASYRFTIDVSRFNAPVRIVPPPADQISGG